MPDAGDGPTIGVDLGGTKVLVAVVAPDGTVGERAKEPTSTEGPEAVTTAEAEPKSND